MRSFFQWRLSRKCVVEAAVQPQLGKIIQGEQEMHLTGLRSTLICLLDFLKLSDETDLDILNTCMETMVEKYTNELLPVAAQLTARLVGEK